MGKWGIFNFEEVMFDDTKNGTKIKKEDYLEQGLYPIIDQGQSQIAGYRNTDDGLYHDIPAIIFGDHTRVIKYIDTPFFLGADGVKLLKSKKDNISYKYLYYFFFKNKVPNTGYNRHFKWLKELTIPIPPLETQKQIAKTLDTAAELLALRKQHLAELDNLIKSTFYDMFGDPVTNDKGWKVVKLPNFYEDPKTSIKCGPFGSALKKEEYVENGVPVWVMDNITKQGDFVDDVFLYITEEKFKVLESYNVKKNDIIISRAGTVGKMCVVNANCPKSIISTNLIRVRLNQKLLPIYLVKLITIWGNKLCRLKTGDDGAFTHMNTGVLDNITFPYPPLDLQIKFAHIVTKIEAQKSLVKKAIDETQYLFDSLMSHYFD